jgi:hypothetical protein
MRSTCVCIAIVALAASSAWSQGNPVGAAPPQAPIGHRQPTAKDVPRDLARGEQQPETASSQGQNARARTGGPPTLNVGPSCEAAGMGAAVLGRDKKACLGDETTAQDTLRQNWSKYAAADKTECIGMVTTGGLMSSCCPASRFCVTRETFAMPTPLRATTARSAPVAAGTNRRGTQLRPLMRQPGRSP